MSLGVDIGQFTYYRGRVALAAILKALGIGAGDQVATQAFTCVAVPEGIMATGAYPLFVDIESSGFNMDAGDLEQRLTLKTRAIIVQHTYGIPADMDPIMAIAEKHNVPIVEDCCHTLTSTYNGQTVGHIGGASFYSFEWGKPLVIGIGGSAVVNDTELEGRLKQSYSAYQEPGLLRQLRIDLQYRGFGMLYRPSFYWPLRALFHKLGSLGVAESNYNPVGQAQVAEDFSLRMAERLRNRLQSRLRKLDAVTVHSRWVAEKYRSGIHSSIVIHPPIPENSKVVFARYPLITDRKPELLLAARKTNVELAEWYATPVHPLSGDELHHVCYEPGSCPNAEQRCNQVVTLPTHQAVSKRDVDRIIAFLNAAGR